MPKNLLRFVAGLISLCLLPDPSWAALAGGHPFQRPISATTLSAFREQAVPPAVREIVPALHPEAGIAQRRLEKQAATIVTTEMFTSWRELFVRLRYTFGFYGIVMVVGGGVIAVVGATTGQIVGVSLCLVGLVDLALVIFVQVLARNAPNADQHSASPADPLHGLGFPPDSLDNIAPVIHPPAAPPETGKSAITPGFVIEKYNLKDLVQRTIAAMALRTKSAEEQFPKALLALNAFLNKWEAAIPEAQFKSLESYLDTLKGLKLEKADEYAQARQIFIEISRILTGPGLKTLLTQSTVDPIADDQLNFEEKFGGSHGIIFSLDAASRGHFREARKIRTDPLDLEMRLSQMAYDAIDDLVDRTRKTQAEPIVDELLRNISEPIIIRVSPSLPVNAARVYDPEGRTVIILNKKFIRTLLYMYNSKKDYHAAKWLLAERLFHELGHTNDIETYTDWNKYLNEETEQVYRDWILNRIIPTQLRLHIDNVFRRENIGNRNNQSNRNKFKFRSGNYYDHYLGLLGKITAASYPYADEKVFKNRIHNMIWQRLQMSETMDLAMKYIPTNGPHDDARGPGGAQIQNQKRPSTLRNAITYSLALIVATLAGTLLWARDAYIGLTFANAWSPVTVLLGSAAVIVMTYLHSRDRDGRGPTVWFGRAREIYKHGPDFIYDAIGNSAERVSDAHDRIVSGAASDINDSLHRILGGAAPPAANESQSIKTEGTLYREIWWPELRQIFNGLRAHNTDAEIMAHIIFKGMGAGTPKSPEEIDRLNLAAETDPELYEKFVIEERQADKVIEVSEPFASYYITDNTADQKMFRDIADSINSLKGKAFRARYYDGKHAAGRGMPTLEIHGPDKYVTIYVVSKPSGVLHLTVWKHKTVFGLKFWDDAMTIEGLAGIPATIPMHRPFQGFAVNTRTGKLAIRITTEARARISREVGEASGAHHFGDIEAKMYLAQLPFELVDAASHSTRPELQLVELPAADVPGRRGLRDKLPMIILGSIGLPVAWVLLNALVPTAMADVVSHSATVAAGVAITRTAPALLPWLEATWIGMILGITLHFYQRYRATVGERKSYYNAVLGWLTGLSIFVCLVTPAPWRDNPWTFIPSAHSALIVTGVYLLRSLQKGRSKSLHSAA